jgi:hypothetical protein
MQVNSAQDYLTQVKRRIVAKTAINSPQPAHRRYNYVYISQLANGQSQFEKVAYPQTLSLAPGSVSGGRPTFSWCCDPYADIKLAAAALPLYAFTTFTFTPAGATGRNGPTLSAAVSAYTATAPWVTNTSYFNMTTQGYQLWTVPQTRSYTVRCAGAASGTSASGFGYGAIIQTTLNLTKGQVLQLLVGQKGLVASNDGGGGGGSFVASGLTPATGVCLAAAGGGGGSSSPSTGALHNNGTNSTSGNNSGFGTGGGTSGGGGSAIGGNLGAGGGFTGNGETGAAPPANSGGLSFINGGTGGNTNGTAFGGFGGGGGTFGSGANGGGGGGYSGGAGAANLFGGGGGGSFPAGATFIGATNTGQGYIIITAV